MRIIQSRGVLIDESPTDYQRFFADPRFIHYVGMLNPPRPGVSDCFETLERRYFPPGTPRNHLYILRILNWMDIGWGIVSIPIGEKNLMERAAQVNRLRIVSGVPTMLTAHATHHFPVSNERIFTLENTRDHPMYSNKL